MPTTRTAADALALACADLAAADDLHDDPNQRQQYARSAADYAAEAALAADADDDTRRAARQCLHTATEITRPTSGPQPRRTRNAAAA